MFQYERGFPLKYHISRTTEGLWKVSSSIYPMLYDYLCEEKAEMLTMY